MLLFRGLVMLLNELLTSLADARELSVLTRENYRRAVTYFGNFIGRPPSVEDLDEDRLNAWLRRSQDDYSPQTVRNLRRDLLVVWRYAADKGLCRYPIGRVIRNPRVDRPVPKAWPVEWIPRLFAAAKTMQGHVRGHDVTRSAYAEAYFRFAVDLLCRPTDLRSMTWSAIHGDTVTWQQNKTRLRQTAKLQAATVEALRKIRHLDQVRIFPIAKTTTERLIRDVFHAARIKRPPRESLGHLRHTGGSAIAGKHGCDAARRALGHSPESRVFERHYLDASHLPIIDATSWYCG